MGYQSVMNRKSKNRVVWSSILAVVGVAVALIGIIQNQSGMIGLGVLVVALAIVPMFAFKGSAPV
jgi:hypothetical protein